MLTTSFRMYNAGPRAAAAWRALFEPVFAELGLEIRVIEHAPPEPIAALWQRPDLCCAFICGWPFLHAQAPLQPIAAPVPAPPRYAGLPRYCSEFLVREQSGWRTLEETFGRTCGWTAADSQSGFNAPRAHLARLADAARGGATAGEAPALFGTVRGPLGTPAQALDALHAGEVDVVALDGYYLDLCRRHWRAKVDGLRTVATTPWTPIPLLVAAPGVDPEIVATLRERLVTLHEASHHAPRLADVLLERFVAVDVDAYRDLESIAAFARERGYETIR